MLIGIDRHISVYIQNTSANVPAPTTTTIRYICIYVYAYICIM
jgi:hypothetical protein